MSAALRLGKQVELCALPKLSVWPGTNCCSVPPRSAGAAELSASPAVTRYSSQALRCLEPRASLCWKLEGR